MLQKATAFKLRTQSDKNLFINNLFTSLIEKIWIYQKE